MNIKLPKGFKLGHADNKTTGVTVILASPKTVGGVSVRGCAPGTRETDLLKPEKAVQEINAIALCGGSAFGLAACDGVIRYLSENNIGYSVGLHKVPLVAGAVIFDLKEKLDYPTSDMGYQACKNAADKNLKFGSIGAGTGASVGKIMGLAFSQKGGIGASTVEVGSVFVTAITVCNAVGDVVDYKTSKIIAGVHDGSGNHLGTANIIMAGAAKTDVGANTTLTCLVTNVKLTKLQANKLADIAHNGYAKSINPVHTDYDGDTIFALSSGELDFDFTALSVMAVEAICQSVVNAVSAEKY